MEIEKSCLFSDYSKDWADFAFKNRNQENQDFSNDCDIVTAPITNDRVGAQIRRFVEGDITFDACNE